MRTPSLDTPSVAEVCVVACAEAWRGDGAIMASPMGLIPTLGARLAQLTFAPDLLLTDGEATLLAPGDGGVAEGWLPYRTVFTMLAGGHRHVMMGAAQLDRFGNQNISCIGDWARPRAQLLGVRGAPGNSINHPVSYWVPRHSRRVFVERADMVCGVGYDRAAGLGPAAARFHELRVVVTNLAVLDFGGPDHGMRLRSVHPGVSATEVAAATGFPLAVPADVPVTPAAHAGRAGPDPGPPRPGRAARRGTPRGTTGSRLIRTPLTRLLGIRHPIVATGMGYVSGARLTAAASAAGALGIIASATMSHGELRSAITGVRERTGAPFGVNLRADAADARERAELIIAERVPVASFAQAPTQELISRLRDAGVITIASVGARRHAEKVAAWGIDAVIATGAEGGGHVGAVPTSLLIPQVVDAVGVPVIAAGGFFDGRGLAAALAYGAAGIAMGTRFLLTSDSPVADAVKRVYLASDVTGTVVTTRADGVPHRLLRTQFVDSLESASRLSGLLRSLRSAAAFRRAAQLTWADLIREGRAARRGTALTWSQVLMAANTPVLLRATMADGRPEAGVMPSGQVAGLIGDLPSCADLIARIIADAEHRLASLGKLAH